jgi:hypothetical protein
MPSEAEANRLVMRVRPACDAPRPEGPRVRMRSAAWWTLQVVGELIASTFAAKRHDSAAWLALLVVGQLIASTFAAKAATCWGCRDQLDAFVVSLPPITADEGSTKPRGHPAAFQPKQARTSEKRPRAQA